MASCAIAIIGQDPAALDYGLVEGGWVRPRDRGDLGLMREEGEAGGPGQEQTDHRPHHSSAGSHRSSP